MIVLFVFPLTPNSVPGICGLLHICGRVLPCVLAPSDFLSLPQRAGYSLQELFHLTRSQVSQQRVLALHVLAQVISRVSGLLAWSCPLTPHPPTLPLSTSCPFHSGSLAHTPWVCESAWERGKPRVRGGQVNG